MKNSGLKSNQMYNLLAVQIDYALWKTVMAENSETLLSSFKKSYWNPIVVQQILFLTLIYSNNSWKHESSNPFFFFFKMGYSKF